MIPRVRPSYSTAEVRDALIPARSVRRDFEAALAEHFGMREAIYFPYGRSAIYGALSALELRGEVVQPAYNCVVVAHATVMAEGVPVFVDCERDSPNQDAEAMVSAVTANTSAAFPTSNFGHTFDAVELVERIRRRNKNALVLMDCAHAFTARWNGEPMAAQGDAAILAFGIGKPMTTLFGGAVMTNRADVAEKVRVWQAKTFSEQSKTLRLKRLLYFLASWGATTGVGTIFADIVERSPLLSAATVKGLRSRDSIRLPSANQTLPAPAEAAIGLAQLSRVDRFMARRREISALYRSELEGTRGIVLPKWEQEAAHTIYTLRLERPEQRTAILGELRRRGVQGGTVLDYVVPALPCYTEMGYRDAYPNATAWASGALNLPNHPTLTDAQVKQCARALKGALDAVANPDGTRVHVREPVS